VLPWETCAEGGPLVEGKTRGALSKSGQGWHQTVGHEALGQGDIEPIEADGQYLATHHFATSLPCAGFAPRWVWAGAKSSLQEILLTSDIRPSVLEETCVQRSAGTEFIQAFPNA
jgi:hypothetical protein